MHEDFFQRLQEDARLADLDFLLVGGHAVNAYGYQRTTLDADLLVSETALGAWRTFLEKRGYRCVHATDAFCQFRSADDAAGFPVDLMIVEDVTYEKLRSRRQQKDVGGALLDVPDPLHLIALKLHALRNEARARQGKDLDDIVGLIQACELDPQGAEFKQVLTRYADERVRKEIRRRLG